MTKVSRKFIVDGKVAIIYSPGFGAGWYTWNTEHGQELIFDPGLIDLLINARPWDEIRSYATLKWPSAYLGGLSGAVVDWVPVGTAFQIAEYDGDESILVKENEDWIIA